MELAGLRKINAAAPFVRVLAESGNVTAMKALGAVADIQDLPIFISGLKSSNAALVEASKDALAEACATIEDKSALTQAISEKIQETKGAADTCLCLCQMLNVTGGAESLKVLRSAALSEDPQLQDCASNALGRTIDPEAAPILLELAKKEGYMYGNRALRGYLRIARQFPMADWARLVMIQNARSCAVFTDKEAETVEIILKQYKLNSEGELNEDQKILSQLEIVSATYGVDEDGKNVDVTAQMREQFRATDSLSFSLEQRWNDLFTDPAPGTVKSMKLVVRLNGIEKELQIREGGTIRIPNEWK